MRSYDSERFPRPNDPGPAEAVGGTGPRPSDRYDANEAEPSVAEAFFDTAIETLEALGERPEGGSLRIGELCAIDGLRVRRIPGFPPAWFYFIRADHIDVARLLGFAQDLPTELCDLA